MQIQADHQAVNDDVAVKTLSMVTRGDNSRKEFQNIQLLAVPKAQGVKLNKLESEPNSQQVVKAVRGRRSALAPSKTLQIGLARGRPHRIRRPVQMMSPEPHGNHRNSELSSFSEIIKPQVSQTTIEIIPHEPKKRGRKPLESTLKKREEKA